MNEMPKKIWVQENGAVGPEKIFSDDVEYIRADLVDDLAELLRLLYKRGLPLTVTMHEGIVVALKQLED